ncbi:hypothetical protein ACHAW6_013281 [Cyclotella cf. meneghiniana]
MTCAHTVLRLVQDVKLTCITKVALVIEHIIEIYIHVEDFLEKRNSCHFTLTCITKVSLVIEHIIEIYIPVEDFLEKRNSCRFVEWRILSKIRLGSQEAGGSRNGTLFAKNLLKALCLAGSQSLGLDQCNTDSFISPHSKLNCDLKR